MKLTVAYGNTVQTCQNTTLTNTLTGYNWCGEWVTFTIVAGPTDGTLGTISQNGATHASITYTPSTNFCGEDSFTFKVNDGGLDSAPATVAISVGDPYPDANFQEVMAGTNTPVTFTLSGASGSGTCDDPLTFTVVPDSEPENGLLSALPQTNATHASFTYTPTNNFEGTDSFLFTVSNCRATSQAALVTILVVPGPTLTTECLPHSIALKWTLPAWLEQRARFGFVKDFRIYRCSTPSGTCAPTTNLYGTVTNWWIVQNPALWTFVDTNVESNTVYCYSVTFRHQYKDQYSGIIYDIYESPYSNTECSSTCCPDSGRGFWTDYGGTPQQLAKWIMGSGFTVSNATNTGAAVAKGTFGNGDAAGLPITNGVILCSGDIALAKGPNDHTSTNSVGINNGLDDGDADLNDLVPNLTTRDAAVLEFDILSATATNIVFDYVFASEEYHYYIGNYNDIMAIWVDGTNIAVVTNTSPPQPIAVNYIHDGYPPHGWPPTNAQYFVNNEDPPTLNIQYNGLTILLYAGAEISPGVSHRIKIAIADATDWSLDSAVFIKAEVPCP